MRKIVILGGGISGLSTAHFLNKNGHDVRILDENKLPGGKVTTREYEGCFCEMGPNTVLMNTEAMVQLLKEYGLFDKIIHPNTRAHKNRYILSNRKLIKVPIKPWQVLFHPLVGVKNRLKLLQLPFKKFDTSHKEVSLRQFMTERFGKDVYRYFVSPFVNGIYAGDPDKILAKYALKIIYDSEQKAEGNTWKGIIGFMKDRKRFKKKYQLPDQLMFTLRGGLSSMGEAIADKLNDHYISEARVSEVSKLGNGTYEVTYDHNGQAHTLHADCVISTIPPDHFVTISRDFNGIGPLKKQKFPYYAPVKVLHIAFYKSDVGISEEGFGVLTLPEENKSFMGILFNSSTFPEIAPPELALFTVFVGGSRQRELCDLPDDDLKNKVVEDVKEVLQASHDPLWVTSKFWKKGIPQFEKGHVSFLTAVEQFESDNKGFYFCGNFLRAVSVSECAEEGKLLAQRIHEELAHGNH